MASPLRSSLSTFLSSPTPFRILRTISHPPSSPLPPTSPIYILDSSFNPPTRAHLALARSALLSSPTGSPRHLLLLLATQNADKAAKPASFEQRVDMMAAFAEDILISLKDESVEEAVAVDVCVTKVPFFVDKTRVIDESRCYLAPGKGGETAEQVHLTGYDTLLRILEPKYYGPEQSLEVLGEMFGRHRLQVTYRAGDKWGGREEQDGFLGRLRSGEVGIKGWKREWAGRIEMVEGVNEGGSVFSSTNVRRAVVRGNWEEVRRLCTSSVVDFLREVDEPIYVGEE